MPLRNGSRQVRIDEAIAKSTFKRLHEKESVSFHHRNAVEGSFKAADDGWQKSLDLRKKLQVQTPIALEHTRTPTQTQTQT